MKVAGSGTGFQRSADIPDSSLFIMNMTTRKVFDDLGNRDEDCFMKACSGALKVGEPRQWVFFKNIRLLCF